MFTMKIDLADGEEIWRYSEFPLYSWITEKLIGNLPRVTEKVELVPRIRLSTKQMAWPQAWPFFCSL